MSVVAAALFMWSGALTRLTVPATPAVVTFGRLGVAALAVLLMALALRHPLRPVLSVQHFVLGVTLFLHFYLFTVAAQTSTIAHALAIVYTAPIFVATGSAVFLRELPTRAQMAGVIAAVAGIAVLVGFEPGASGASALGDLAALGSAVTLAAYVLAGRWLRGANPLATYVMGVYGWAAIAALPAAAATFDADAFGEAALWIVLLGIGPLAVGHTLINAALRRLPATVPNVIATQEVPAGVLIGALLVHEVPGLTTLIGGLIALGGVILVVVGTRRGDPAEASRCRPGRRETGAGEGVERS